MKHLWLCAAVVSIAGCTADAAPVADAGAPDSPMLPLGCDVPVAAGEFTLQMVGLLNARGGFPLDLRADGTFTGVMPMANEHCEGTLTATESANLTATLNAASLFCHRLRAAESRL